MDPATMMAVLSLARLGVELAQMYQAGQLTTDQVNQYLAQAGINVDSAVTAWNAAKGLSAPTT